MGKALEAVLDEIAKSVVFEMSAKIMNVLNLPLTDIQLTDFFAGRRISASWSEKTDLSITDTKLYISVYLDLNNNQIILNLDYRANMQNLDTKVKKEFKSVFERGFESKREADIFINQVFEFLHLNKF